MKYTGRTDTRRTILSGSGAAVNLRRQTDKGETHAKSFTLRITWPQGEMNSVTQQPGREEGSTSGRDPITRPRNPAATGRASGRMYINQVLTLSPLTNLIHGHKVENIRE